VCIISKMLFLVCLTLKMGILGKNVGNCLQFYTVYHFHEDLNHQHCWENVKFHYIMFTVLVGWGSSHGYERFITSHLMCILHHSVYIKVTEHCIKPYSPLQHDDKSIYKYLCQYTTELFNTILLLSRTWRHVSTAHTAIFRPAYNRIRPLMHTQYGIPHCLHLKYMRNKYI